MKHSFFTTCLITALCVLTVRSTQAQTNIPGPDTEVPTEKRAQTGFKFLTTSLDARASAMGGAVTSSTVGSSIGLFYNPASMARMTTDFHATAGQIEHLVDWRYNYASAAYVPAGGDFGVVGVSFMNVDYGDFFETIRADNDEGFIELGTYSPTALAIGVGYARSFTDRFSVGAHVKYALQDLGTFAVSRVESGGTPVEEDGTNVAMRDYSLNTLAVDFGILYNTGFRSLTIAMSTRNFSRELIYERERFELPLTFQIGMSMNLMDLTTLDPNMHSLQLAVDAQRPRDFDEHVKIGAEYTLMNVLSVRGGWGQAFVGDDTEEGLSFGAGLQYEIQGIGFGADYAYTDFGIFGELQRIALQFSL